LYRALLRRVKEHYGGQYAVPISKQAFIHQNLGRLDQCYVLGRQLGKGSFGVVHACTDKRTGQARVCKGIDKVGGQS
jgi:serine/threonine protein kinase